MTLVLRLGIALSCGALLLLAALKLLEALLPRTATAASGQVLAPVGRQVGWLELTAPRRQVLARLDEPASVSDVAATATSPYAALAVCAPFGAKQGTAGDDLVRMDTTSGELSPLITWSLAPWAVRRLSARIAVESLVSVPRRQRCSRVGPG